MLWLLLVLGLIVAIVLAVLFLNRFYVKSGRDTALIRTGAGGRLVVIDGGCLALPILHKVDVIAMNTQRLDIARAGRQSLITEDRLRLDVEMEFHVRVIPTAEGIATAAQAFGARSLRGGELQRLIEGKLINAMQAVAAERTMEALHQGRAAFVNAVAALLAENLGESGLKLDAASLVHLDQTPFAALDENNVFNAVGMRKLAEIVSDNRKARARIEAEADIVVRETQLEQAQRRISLEQQHRESEIAQRQALQEREAESDAGIAQSRSDADRRIEAAKIAREAALKQAEIARDRSLREQEIEALHAVEFAEIDSAIRLAAKKADETRAAAESEKARAEVVLAQEHVQTQKDQAAAERSREIALMKAREASEVEKSRIKTQVDNLVAMAQAEANATELRAGAERARMLAESEGKSALIQAENGLSEPVIRMKLDMHRLDRLPEIATQMMKPVEKIKSIRINQIAGLGGNGGGGGGSGAGEGISGPFDQALQSILGMAVQLPAMRRIGEEIGLDMDVNLAGRVQESASRSAQRGTVSGGAPNQKTEDN
ncbi:flotillin family protein [Oceanibacterium hippocampi]|uniref:Inner membrane protein YqiK n=1 Tax=Oceanibacterium hippocampi TaxID=745714 RepID=A0A1Y5TI64_9PROT|nr:flotillin domain-containing protein [Oceanibacterium hippocampi]SLN60916.1 Inner membrane protein YqiK [Oceanibacterium hippocampi]